MSKIKVIYLSPVDFFKGGAERSLFDLLSNPDVEPILLAPDDGEILSKAKKMGIETFVLPFRSINNVHRPFSFMKGLRVIKDLIKTARELKRISKQTGAKIVHSNGLKAHMINCVSFRLGGAKAVLHIRDIPYTKPEVLIWKIMHFLSYAMVLVSHACWPDSKLPPKAYVIHNGTPLIDVNKVEEIRGGEQITIGFVGRIHPGKGLHLLVDWVAAALLENVNVRLSVRGAFSEDAPEYADEINEQIEVLGVKKYVEFTGFISDPETLYKGLDIVAVPSKAPDPLPRSVMESMARGIPVLGYPAGGILEMIDDGQTGFLVDDEESFIKSIQKIIDNPDVLTRMMKEARCTIEREFTIGGLHKGIMEVYKRTGF